MVEPRTGSILSWVAAAVLVVLLALSLTGTGTVMGGWPMGWAMILPVALLGAVVYLAYRFGRLERQSDDNPRMTDRGK